MLKIEQYSFHYTDEKSEGIENINIHVKKGQCILLCGKSGCGKTTIIRAINGLIPYFYAGKLKGQVLLNNQPVENRKMYELSEQVGTVFQNPRSQFFNVDTDSEIVFGMENMAYPKEMMEERMRQITSELRLERLRRRNIFHLSGGEKQKIAFASVYAVAPDIFVLDEPSSNLDAAAIEDLKDMIALLKMQGKTIIVSEHRLYYLKELIDKAIVLNKGQIVSVYSQKDFLQLSDLQLRQLGLRTLYLDNVQFQHKSLPAEQKFHELVVKDVTIKHKKRKVLENIQFTAKSGEIIAITGHNGAGKTTFARAICGLHKLSSGNIYFNKQKLTLKKRAQLSYMVMQDVNYQLFAETVEKECVFGVKHPNPNLVRKALEEMDLLELVNRHPNTLSGGQKQRLAVAASLISEKEIIVFDEPTSGLDFDSMQKVSSILQNLAEANKIIFVITHDLEFIASCCHRILRFGDGMKQDDYKLNKENHQYTIETFTR
ncbi:ABC transporter ATP-binding protein [Lysinibacillus sp. NPDC095746]|uniref:ABC transporter ATP-binding protein n=1 Tax=Lysinibacillus sp. NPDC095746 TaxID=3364134 RepID=UPI0038223E8C